MPLLKYIKKIKNFSVIFIPEDASQKARSVKLSFQSLIWLVIIYTILIATVAFYALSLSGLNKYLLPSDINYTAEERQKVDELNSKIIFLAKELEKLKATNERLKYSLILGDSTLFDSLNQVQDSVDQSSENHYEGDIFLVVQKLFSRLIYQDDVLLFIKPVNSYLSRKFNPEKGHMGLDYVVKENTPVYAAAGGYVVFSDYTVDDGYMVIVNHIRGYVTVYKHCSALLKKTREYVEQGELLALSGNTGQNTTGPHLHFEIWKDGIPMNPENLFINY